MPSRRDFIKTSGLAAAGLAISGNALATGLRDNTLEHLTSQSQFSASSNFVSKRPPLSERKFTSEAVEAKIAQIKKDISDEELAWMFENCFPNTLDTTVTFKYSHGKPDTFVITGDINAMWLRDSTAQVFPYLPLTKEDEKLKELIAGVINRQTKCILIDPYANAFNDGPGHSEWMSDLTDMKPELHERKWEIDSLCYPIRLSYNYWKTTRDESVFSDEWYNAMKLVLITFKEQQRKDGNQKSPYKFQRVTGWQSDTVAGGGYGNPIVPVGLIVSIFRPSDDATIFSFLIPSNYFAVISLRQLSDILMNVKHDKTFADECNALADEVEKALNKFAKSEHLDFGTMIPYEVDGYGNKHFMDDANIPSLLSLPYLDAIEIENPLYKNTRKFLLSQSNPYFFKGSAGEGIGGPHAGVNQIWHLSIIMQALTSDDKNEIKKCLHTIKNTHANTGFMHESFNKDNPEKFSRSWFAWANTLFGELIIKIHQNHPELLKS
ncbi:MAG: glycoside hydrolase family 125 protein [Melioribacteraceae bacterium]|nr:glycoside hydrolase family 125 protein [Melioribacteraceae bacterium]